MLPQPGHMAPFRLHGHILLLEALLQCHHPHSGPFALLPSSDHQLPLFSALWSLLPSQTISSRSEAQPP